MSKTWPYKVNTIVKLLLTYYSLFCKYWLLVSLSLSFFLITILNIGPVTEWILCFVCPILLGINTFVMNLQKSECLVEIKEHCPFFFRIRSRKTQRTWYFQIRSISQLLLLIHLLDLVCHDVGATNTFTLMNYQIYYNESSDIFYYKFLFFIHLIQFLKYWDHLSWPHICLYYCTSEHFHSLGPSHIVDIWKKKISPPYYLS